MSRVIVQPKKEWFRNSKGNLCYGQVEYPMYEVVPAGKGYVVQYYGCAVQRCSDEALAEKYITAHLQK